MERHTIPKNAPSTIKVPLQRLSKSGKTIFAYLRRSTNKKTQEESIETQNKRVLKLARKLWYTEKDVQIFEDPWFSGYREVKTKDGRITKRPRKWFTALLEAIDKSIEPCILLVNNYSRLARNADDGGVIIERLWHKGNKQKIEAIHFCIWGDVWDKSTKKTHMQDCFNQAEEESEVKSEYMRANIEDHLEKRIFPPMIPTPPWLKATRRGLEETNLIAYIREAMKMRIERKTLKDIEKYLKLYWIKTSLANITKTIFENPIYIGEYTDKKTWLYIPDLIFVKGKPPIDRAMFYDLQKVIGRKVGGYGNKQRWDIIAPLLRWEWDEDRRYAFSLETPKGKYKSYKSGAFGGFNKSEIKIIKEFLNQAIPKIIDGYYSFYQVKKEENDKKMIVEFRWLKEVESKEWSLEEMERAKIDLARLEKENEKLVNIMSLYAEGYDIKELLKMTHKELLEEEKENFERIKLLDTEASEKRRKEVFMRYHTPTYRNLKQTFDEWFYQYWKLYSIVNSVSADDFLACIQDLDKRRISALEYGKNKMISLINKSNSEEFNKEKEVKQDVVESLQARYKELEEEKDSVYMRYADMGYPITIADKKVEIIQNEMMHLESQIKELRESTNVEQFLERLPEVLWKTFELASKAISSEDIATIRDDIEQLIELVTFELQISTKKELTVKLFEGLDEMFFVNGPPDKNRTCD